MREIKFRGKEIDTKEWVYGGIVHQTDYYGSKCDKYFIIDGEGTYDYDMGENQLVDGNTVGQYIGRKDKNGVEIYEGDIVYIKYAYGYFKDAITTVVYKESSFEFVLEDGTGWIITVTDHNKDEIEVIGNVYDGYDKKKIRISIDDAYRRLYIVAKENGDKYMQERIKESAKMEGIDIQ